jgi:RimJ/RimL family protein N-acetyltransferase
MLKEVKLKDGTLLSIDHAEPNDAKEIVEYLKVIGRETPFLTFGADGIPLTVEEESEYLRSMLDPKVGLYLKGVVSGKIISNLHCQRRNRPKLTHICELGVAVVSQYWGIGICHALLKTAFEWGKNVGIRKFNLQVHEENERAIRLYESLGFQREGSRSRAFCIDGRFYSEIFMGIEV